MLKKKNRRFDFVHHQNSDHQAHRHLHYMHLLPRKPNLKIQPCRQICPLGSKTFHPDFFLLSIPGKALRAEGWEEIKYILSVGPFLQVTLGFSASNTWLFGKSAKRMKHEVSESHPTHCFTHGTVFSPTWIHDRCIWNKRM